MERFFRNKTLFTVIIVLIFLVMTGLIGALSLFARDLFPFAAPVGASSSSSQAESPREKGGSAVQGPQFAAPSSKEESDEPSQEESDSEDEGAGEDSSSEEEESSSSNGESFDPALGEEEEKDENKEENVHYNVPDEMRAVYLTPGVDYPTSGGAQAIEEGIAKALESAKALTMNTVVALPYGDGKAIYQTGEMQPATNEIDILQTIVDKAREQDMYVYAVYEASTIDQGGNAVRQERVDTGVIDFAAENAAKFADKYQLDGILVDSYYNETLPDSYAGYIKSGAGIGYREYMRSYSEALFTAVSGAIRESAKGTQVGIVVDGVWENAAAEPEGTQTAAQFTALSGGNADTKKFVTEKLADFVALRPGGYTDSGTEPFQEVAQWWSKVAQASGLPLYVIYPEDKVCTDAPGFSSPDEIAQQVIYAQECEAYEGGIFNSLSRLIENPQTSTDLLIKLFKHEVNVDHVLTELAVTKPDQMEFSTFEPVMVFRGASDPNFEVSVNGEVLDTDENGYFTTTQDLEPGLNTFTFEHKGKSQVFKITRNVQIIKEVSPTGSVALEGGMKLQITALAYEDAAVSASLGGASIPMSKDTSIDDSTDEDSSYVKFVGEYTVPAATGEKQNLGTLKISGQWQGISDSKEGASISINPVVAAGDGDLIVVTAEAAKTFPPDKLGNETDPAYFPLPKGTKDYTVGEMITYKNGDDTYKYYKLQSGVRVYADDINKTSGELSTGNVIESMKITSDKRYTYVTLDTQQPVPYTVSYSSSGIKFDFKYTSSTPKSQKVSDNPVIRSADWSEGTLSLGFTQSGSFLGYHSYYKGDKLVLRLTNPPTSISNVRIAIDPGHGGKDKGTAGYYPDVSEAEINAVIAEKTAEALADKGAEVKLIKTDPYLTLNQRLEAARAYDANIYISIHSNSSVNTSATGSEVYYFYPFGQTLASISSKQVSNALDTDNRGAKQARYWVTTDSRFASVLIECGFLSNKSEYKKLTKSSYQDKVAEAIADSVASYVKTISTGISGGNDDPIDEDEEEDESSGSGDGSVSGVSLSKSSIKLKVGETYRLEAQVKPSDAEDTRVEWESDDEDVVTVSSSGKLKAVSEGSATVTVTTRDGDYTKKCKVEVVSDDEDDDNDEEIEDIEITESRVTLEEGDTYQIEVEITPSSLEDDAELEYESDDEEVATVSSSGKVRARGEGTAVITVSTTDGSELSDRIKITVE